MDMKKILQAIDGASSTKAVEGSNDMKKFLTIVEGKGPLNRLTQAENIAMQQYNTTPVLNVAKNNKPSLVGKYFKQVETEMLEAQERSNSRAKKIAEVASKKVMERIPIGPGVSPEQVDAAIAYKQKIGDLQESPIEINPSEPNNPTIYGHEKANPMTLKGRIMQARNQLRELADMAESNELVVWERITKLAKGGMFMGLQQNLEQINHGIAELAAKRRKGGVSSRGIDRNIG